MFFHSAENGPNSDAIINCFKQAISLCKKNKITELGLAVSDKKHLTSSSVEEAFGTKFVKTMKKNNEVNINGINISLFTKRIDPAQFQAGPIIAIDIVPSFVEDLVDKYEQSDFVYKPWTEEELDEYLSNHGNSTQI